jgi:hypothetical protein
MRKLFIYLLIVVAAVASVSQPAFAKPYSKTECWWYQSWGQVCEVCQTTYYDEDGRPTIWGPPVTTCYPTNQN